MQIRGIKKIFSPSLSSKISKQISVHKTHGHNFLKEIVCAIEEDYSGPHLCASLISTHPEAGGIGDSAQVWFYKKNIESIEYGFNELTFEVSRAQSKFPKLIFFHMLNLRENDAIEYVKKEGKLTVSEKSGMLFNGSRCRGKTCKVFEIYVSGSWQLTNALTREDSKGYYL